MRLRRPSSASAPCSEGGFLLIEVMVAVLLSALVVVPLATCLQRAARQAQALTVDYGELQETEYQGATGGSAGPWGWGPAARRVIWRPGPEIDVWVDSGSSSGMEIGIWADGWFLGEWLAESGGEATTVDVQWSALMGCELCIRARETSGVWGPPWRCVVPDEYGDVGASPAGAETEGSATTALHAGAIVLHTRSYSTPSVRTSWAETVTYESAAGVVIFLPECGPGYCEVKVGSERQSWHMDSDRGLDVYF